MLYRNNRKQHIKRVSSQSLYHNLKHGDIVFGSPNQDNHILDQMILTLNQGTNHIFLIIEENNEKYAFHAFPSSNPEEYEVDSTPFFGKLGGPTMVLIKEPLKQMVTIANSCTYQVFRTGLDIKIPENFQLDRNAYIHYCTRAIGPLLAKMGIINVDRRLILPYRPDYIANQLIHKGVPCFYMYHDLNL